MHYMQAGALEDVVKTSQLEIIELKHTVDQLRYLASGSNARLITGGYLLFVQFEVL